MAELIELSPLKTVKPRRSHKRSYTLTTAQAVSDSSDDESSSNDESPIVLNLQPKSSKASKRNNMIQTLPLIIKTQPVKEKKKHRQKHIQQFVINTQPPPPPPSSPKKKEIVFEPIIRSSLSPAIQYVPISAPTTSLTRVVERPSYAYRHVYTPTLIEERRPFGFYNSYESPTRKIIRTYPPNSRSVHLPKHAKKLVNRFLNGMEHAHGHRYGYDSDSDHSIDDCRVCRRLRSAMDNGRRKSYSEVDVYRGSRVLFETQEPHTHKHGHSKHCKVCDLLEKNNFAISTIEDHSKSNKKKREKQVHIVESFPSRIKPIEQTTTTTTTQPNLLVKNSTTAVSSVPIQPTQYPMSYTTYVDPNTGLTYAYDPNWQYDPSGTGMTYDYSSYYTNPTYIQSNPQYQTYNTSVPVTTNPLNSTVEQQQQQQQTQTTNIISSNPLVDTGTYTYMPTNRKERKPTNTTVVVHTSRNPTPPRPNIIIEQPRPARLPRKIKSTTILKERTTQTPHTTTTTYVRT